MVRRCVMRTLAVINPRSGGGRTGAMHSAIEAALKAALGDVTAVATLQAGDATRIVNEALAAGYQRIVAIGGDGTLNEVVNGFFRDGTSIAPDAVFSFAMSGSGGDFRRTFGIEGDTLTAIAALAHASPRPIDLGRVTFATPRGEATRHFVNIASFGLSGEVVNRVNRALIAKWFGGPFTFKWHSTMAALTFRPWRVRLCVDDIFDEVIDASTVAVCNGRYFGGGMKIAPDAAPDDGLFDVVIIAQSRTREMIARMNDIYSGAHVHHPNVKVLRGRRVIAAPVTERAAFAERDGEGGMQLPATFENLPGALTLWI
jgi:YegS/Rv2252/BmrU family lipid kinase